MPTTRHTDYPASVVIPDTVDDIPWPMDTPGERRRKHLRVQESRIRAAEGWARASGWQRWEGGESC